jgi:hypothetical protein
VVGGELWKEGSEEREETGFKFLINGRAVSLSGSVVQCSETIRPVTCTIFSNTAYSEITNTKTEH